jgi:hypothetical protein
VSEQVTTPEAAPQTTAVPSSDNTFAALYAFDRYLVAVTEEEVLASSTGAAAAVGLIEHTIREINSSRGGATSTRLERESFTPASDADGTVVFTGSVQIVTDVRGDRGEHQSIHTVEGPVTVHETADGWKVADFLFDGRPLQYTQTHATQVVDGIHLAVSYVASFGNTTYVVIGLSADSGDIHLRLVDAVLTTDAATTGGGVANFTSEARPTGLVRFVRNDGALNRFDAQFDRGAGATAAFSLALPG